MMVNEDNMLSPLLARGEGLRDASRARARRMSDEDDLFSTFQTSPDIVRQEELIVPNVILVIDEVLDELTEDFSDFLSLEVEVSFSLMSSPLSVIFGESTSDVTRLSVDSTISVDEGDICSDEDYDADISSFVDDEDNQEI